MSKKICRNIFLLLLAFLFVGNSCGTVLAENISQVPYTNYTYWQSDSSKFPVETKAVYKPHTVLSGENLGISGYTELQYLGVFGENLYVLDSANGEIIILNHEYQEQRKISDLSYNNEVLSFSGAKGFYVDSYGIYIADTANKRLIYADHEGRVKKIVLRPDDPTIPDTYDFAPIRLVKDSCGYFYLLCEGSYYGMMVFNESFEFCGFFGANNVTTSFSTAISQFVLSLFETEEKHSNSVQSLPFSLLDICLDREGFLVTVNGETSGQIRRFGLTGKNILKNSSGLKAFNTDSFNFADSPVMYVDKTSKYNTFLQCAFSAITCDSHGFYYAVEGTQGRIYMYDTQSNLLSVFGGGIRQGSQIGTFISPSSIVTFGDDLLVSDFSTGKITVFHVTDYGKALMIADEHFVKNEYEKAKPYFETVIRQDKNCQIAYRGLAKAHLKEGNYKKAMEYAKSGLDKKTYAQAFEFIRNKFIAKNFWWIFLIILSVLVLLIYLLFIREKKTDRQLNPRIQTLFKVPVHPIEAFSDIKYKQRGSIRISSILLIFYYVTQVLTVLYGGFAFSTVQLTTYNAFLTLLGTVGIVLLWTVSNWLVCILFEGKGKIKEIYCSSCYCLIPLIFYNICYVFLSNVLTPTTNSFFGLFGTISTLITAVFILLSVMTIHEFSFFKSMAISVVVLVAMAIVAFVLFIMLTLWQDLINFIMQLINEAAMR